MNQNEYIIQTKILRMMSYLLQDEKYMEKLCVAHGIPLECLEKQITVMAGFFFIIKYHIDTGSNFLDSNLYEGAKIYYEERLKEREK